MDVTAFAINLDRSTDRWRTLSGQAREFDLPLIRVSAVDGIGISEADQEAVNRPAFHRNAGRLMLAAEYGCYRSHLKALHEFLGSQATIGLIIEDDLTLKHDLYARVEAAFHSTPKAHVIKFFSNRIVGFRRATTSCFGDEIGRAIHGPLGSSACYAVSRFGAELLINKLAVMCHPWDVALERGWDHGAEVYVLRNNIVTVARGETTIATRDIYRSVKFPKSKRLGTYIRRLQDDVARIYYTFQA